MGLGVSSGCVCGREGRGRKHLKIEVELFMQQLNHKSDHLSFRVNHSLNKWAL